MAEQTVTVFGGTGFLGREVVRCLARQGFFVRVAARKAEAAEFRELEDGSWQAIGCDIRDEQSVARAVEGVHAVVNAVSLYVEKGPLSFEVIHVDGAERIARCSREAGVERLVHISGIGSSTTSPSSYVRARARGEEIVRETFPEATILSPSVLCAPGEGFLASLDAVTRMPVVPLFGRGDMRMQPVAVTDVARAVVEAIAQPETRGRVFELGGAGVYTYRQLLEEFMEHRGRRRLLLPFPLPLWHAMGTLLSVLPDPPLTRDQLYLIQEDNVAGEDAAGFPELGLQSEKISDLFLQKKK